MHKLAFKSRYIDFFVIISIISVCDVWKCVKFTNFTNRMDQRNELQWAWMIWSSSERILKLVLCVYTVQPLKTLSIHPWVHRFYETGCSWGSCFHTECTSLSWTVSRWFWSVSWVMSWPFSFSSNLLAAEVS